MKEITESRLDICEDKLKKHLCRGKYPNEKNIVLKDLENFKQSCFNYAIEEHIKKLWLERRNMQKG